MIWVVFDTNVLVSALLFENGSTYLASNLLDPVARADAAAASYPSGVVVAERRSTAAATGS